MERAVSAGGRALEEPSDEPKEGLAFISGEVVPIEDARIPIMDTGFVRSDATYDAVAVWGGAFFRLNDHLDRFQESCRKLRLSPPYDCNGVSEILHHLVSRSGWREAFVQVVCTRGVAKGGVRDPRKYENQLYAFVTPYVRLLPWEERDSGMDAVIARTVERISSRAVDPTAKNFHWADLTRGLYEAYDRGARYPILLSAEGYITEGAGYNVFAVVDGRLYTPDSGVLEGITRRSILELATRNGIPTDVRQVPEELFRRGQEMFATTTAGGVLPITSLDGAAVGDGRAGPVTRRLRDLYWEAHDDPQYLSLVAYDRAESPAALTHSA
jgi:branched-chain amino acid aminotransferase